ncbi:hypothetical protein LZ554_004946 [Drepanopeziza brunnea f. sp. 'monogermtubi']|nr:hypothetical protein LZ554_004946 [Drepanopeziza brunnea f. sp. 'monogermtubi']
MFRFPGPFPESGLTYLWIRTGADSTTVVPGYDLNTIRKPNTYASFDSGGPSKASGDIFVFNMAENSVSAIIRMHFPKTGPLITLRKILEPPNQKDEAPAKVPRAVDSLAAIELVEELEDLIDSVSIFQTLISLLLLVLKIWYFYYPDLAIDSYTVSTLEMALHREWFSEQSFTCLHKSVVAEPSSSRAKLLEMTAEHAAVNASTIQDKAELESFGR